MAKILLVDDDEQLLHRMVQEFRSAGHTCLGQTSGEAAMNQLEQERVDLLVLDVMLPGISGFEICRRIRSNQEHYNVPILFLSAMNSEEEIAHGLAQGADDYLTKPFRIDMLLKRVEGLLNQQAQTPNQDPLTALLSAKAVKLEIQRALNTRQGFQLAYIEMLNITDLGRVVGDQERMKAIRHLARGLTALGEQLPQESFNLGHLGGGHFLCILPKGVAEEYARATHKMWRTHLTEFYQSIGKSPSHTPAPIAGGNAAVPMLDLSFFITTFDGSGARSFRDLFDTLSRLRESARGRSGGIYVDRRG